MGLTNKLAIWALGVAVVGCSAADFAPEPSFETELNAYPNVRVECTGEHGLTVVACTRWAEDMLQAAPPVIPSIGEWDGRLVLIYRAGGGRCAADFYAPDGRAVASNSVPCPQIGG